MTNGNRWVHNELWQFPGIGWAAAGGVLRSGIVIILLCELLFLPVGIYRDLSSHGAIPFMYTALGLTVLWTASAMHWIPDRFIVPWASLMLFLFSVTQAIDASSPVIGIMVANMSMLLLFWAAGLRLALLIFVLQVVSLGILHSVFVAPLTGFELLLIGVSELFLIPHMLSVSAYLNNVNRTLNWVHVLETRIDTRSESELRAVALLAQDFRSAASALAPMLDPGAKEVAPVEDIRAALIRLKTTMDALESGAGTGEERVTLEPFNIDTLLAGVAWVLSPGLAEPGVSLRVTPAFSTTGSGSGEFYSDRVRLRQAMLALARLGLHLYGAERIELGAHISPGVGDDTQSLLLSLRVIGPVVTASALEAQFNAEQPSTGNEGVVWYEFHRAQALLAPLGAAIDFEQRITAAGERELQFSIRAPLAGNRDDDSEECGEAFIGQGSDPDSGELCGEREGRGQIEPGSVLAGASVLLVEDDPITRRATSSLLQRKMGARVTAAASVPEAKRFLSEGSFSLVITDYVMGGANADELLLAIQVKEIVTPVIVATASAMSREVLELRRLGAAAVLAKPVSASDFELAARAVLSSATIAPANEDGEPEHE